MRNFRHSYMMMAMHMYCMCKVTRAQIPAPTSF